MQSEQQQRDLFQSEDKETYNKAVKSLGEEWASVLWQEFAKQYMISLSRFIRKEAETYTIQPSLNNIFRAYRECPFSNTKIVMIGQDPYPHSAADGLAFSSSNGSTPASLSRLYTEIKKDLGDASMSQRLNGWAKQGVLLLNKSLTVRQDQPLSHQDKGWENFISETVQRLDDESVPIAFVFFGNKAAEGLSKLIVSDHHMVIKASHPARQESYEKNLKDRGYFRQLYYFIRENYGFNLYL